MPRILELQHNITLHSADRYPRSNNEAVLIGLSGRRNEEMRAMTIAAFRIAQNNTQLSQQSMDIDLLEFLLANSTSAVGHWQRKRRLHRSDAFYRLTPIGITECQNTLLGLTGAYNTTERKVQEWIDRMLSGDNVATRHHTFTPSSWTAP